MSSSMSKLFVRQIKVPSHNQTVGRPLQFYVGLNKVGRVATTRLILEHGGKVSAHPAEDNSNIIALVDPLSKSRENCRTAYSVAYIAACVEQKKLLDLEDFRLKPTKTPGPKTFMNRLKRQTGVRKSNVQERVAKGTRPNNKVPPQNTEVPGGIMVKGSAQKPTPRGDKRVRSGVPKERESRPGALPVQKGSAQIQPPGKVTHNRKVLSKESTKARPDAAPRHLKWTPAEDQSIADLYMRAVSSYQQQGKDTALAKAVSCWVTLEPTGLLPPGRTPQDCLDRVLELNKCGVGAKKRRASAPSAARSAPVFEAKDFDSDDDFISNVAKDGPVSPTKNRKVRGVRSATTSPALKPAAGSSFKGGRKKTSEKTKERIRWIVAGLAIRGKVSERTAFRALRAQEGNWRKALRAIVQSKSHENKSR